MAVQGMNGGAPSPLDRFQQIRDLAKKKLDGDENRARLADLLKQKQAELAAGAGQGAGSARAAAAPIRKFELPVSNAAFGSGAATAAGAAGLGGLAAYGRGGASEKPDPRPSLGRYIDLTA